MHSPRPPPLLPPSHVLQGLLGVLLIDVHQLVHAHPYRREEEPEQPSVPGGDTLRWEEERALNWGFQARANCLSRIYTLVRSDPTSHLAQCVRRKRLVLQQLLVCVLPRPYSQLLSAQRLDPLNLGQLGGVPLTGGQGTVGQGQCRREKGGRG